MDILSDTFKKTMNAISTAIIETSLLYIALPLIIAAVILRVVFRLKGQSFKIVYGIVAIICAYFFIYKGIPHYADVYNSKLAQ
ncbi:hypothetical protein H1230_18260 [Paenibacillus sp. 19GGS1-52]|uniref:hypothetical protein n=1 Tax=Paenibacillus sp. 19GGS1-52 TaxID=2758563 RepID=UPI001EFBF0FB|nr:hypothetical protein [Paenibacillus sp. 19GGS1-52]ULO05063.1 hypothetical protein H1230_18260 [Paenibacillus sp. 19GGS1-52]